ncbi:MAG: alpha-1,2-fucosyltransferase [Ruminococcus sp.]|nr:alpha-1,2-fucosyltransferase [Ruminococcus sp.]
MDIVRFAGGLGNQMFQYAFMEALKNRGRDVRASLGYYRRHPDARHFSLIDVFPNLELTYVSDVEFDEIDEKWKKIRAGNLQEEFCKNYSDRFFWVEDVEKEPGVYQPNVFLTQNCVFVGYWQTDKYFKSIQNVLNLKFKFTHINQELKEFGDRLSEESYVSVHVRRGDYLRNPDIYASICTKSYYEKAIEYFQNKEKYSKFVFFSDDLKWVTENLFVPNAIYCNKKMFAYYEDWYDMYLMARCRHNIIANSSFSWWGAWLNQNEDKIVIAPKKWCGYSATPDIWCEDWIKI